MYGLGEAPRGLLPSTYQVFYFDSAGQQIQHARVELNLSKAMAAELGPIDGAGIQGVVGATGDAVHRVQAAKGQLSLPLPAAAMTATSTAASAQLSLTRDQAAHKMTQESDQQKYAFVHNAKHMGAIGEAVMINRMLRQEMMELNKQAQLGSQAAFADVEKQLAAIRMIRQAQKEILQDLKEMVPPERPQKIDWFPLANHAIQTVSEIGVALIKSLPSSAAPQAAPQVTRQIAAPVAPRAPAPRSSADVGDQPAATAVPKSFAHPREPKLEMRMRTQMQLYRIS